MLQAPARELRSAFHRPAQGCMTAPASPCVSSAGGDLRAHHSSLSAGLAEGHAVALTRNTWAMPMGAIIESLTGKNRRAVAVRTQLVVGDIQASEACPVAGVLQSWSPRKHKTCRGYPSGPSTGHAGCQRRHHGKAFSLRRQPLTGVAFERSIAITEWSQKMKERAQSPARHSVVSTEAQMCKLHQALEPKMGSTSAAPVRGEPMQGCEAGRAKRASRPSSCSRLLARLSVVSVLRPITRIALSAALPCPNTVSV